MAPQFPGSDGWENARPHARLSGPIRRHYFRIARRSGGTSVRPLAIVMTLLVLVETQFRARRKCHCFCLSLNSANQF